MSQGNLATSLAGEAPTRREQLLGLLQREFAGYHPLISIARLAHHGDADLRLQFDCHRTIAKYVEPELKSIEVKGEIQNRHRVHVSMFEDRDFPPVTGGGGLPPEALEHGDTGARLLPGGATIDVTPEVVDRVVQSGW